MLPYADYVKVDRRDIYERGSELVDLARSTGATLVAERIETREQLESCLGLGFDLLQGFYLETAHVLNRTPVPSSRPDRPALRVLDALRPRLPEAAVSF
jgi:EAL and modified HD-GYP domain-containing signal transduction protein